MYHTADYLEGKKKVTKLLRTSSEMLMAFVTASLKKRQFWRVLL